MTKSNIDEIVDSMIEILKTASAIDEFKAALQEAKTQKEVDDIHEKYSWALKKETSMEDVETLINMRKSQLPAADDNTYAGLISSLISIADDLDSRGLEKLADIVDETIEKIQEIDPDLASLKETDRPLKISYLSHKLENIVQEILKEIDFLKSIHFPEEANNYLKEVETATKEISTNINNLIDHASLFGDFVMEMELKK
jgi:DNA repair exonuclease SbcCD ATPase subunit